MNNYKVKIVTEKSSECGEFTSACDQPHTAVSICWSRLNERAGRDRHHDAVLPKGGMITIYVTLLEEGVREGHHCKELDR